MVDLLEVASPGPREWMSVEDILLCGNVGIQRFFFAGEAAGVRTHVLVGLGAAMFTMISGYAFHTTAGDVERGA
jgi:putative Mg2+ transporter-C (MgtC) family protein